MHPESGGSVATPKIRLQHVSKRFASGPAAVPTLHNVDLSIHEGDFVTLIGPSGCGKSTLFNILVGLVPPDEGGALMVSNHQSYLDPAVLGAQLRRPMSYRGARCWTTRSLPRRSTVWPAQRRASGPGGHSTASA